MKFAKVTTILLWVILAISLFLTVSLLANLDPNATDPGMNTWINANLVWSYILLAICCIAALVLEFINTISDKKAAKNALMGIGLLGAVILISYLISDSEIPQFYGVEKFVEKGELTPSISHWIGTGLIATYILSAISIIGIVYSSVSNFFK